MVLEALVEQRTRALLDGGAGQAQRATTVLDGHRQLAARLVTSGFGRRVVHVLRVLVTDRTTLGAEHLAGTQPHIHASVLHFTVFRLFGGPFTTIKGDILEIGETLVDRFAQQVFVGNAFRRPFGRCGGQRDARRNSPAKRTNELLDIF